MSYKANNLPSDKHVFLGRKGGISEGKYASLNIRKQSYDDAAKVEANRQIAVSILGGKIEDLMFLGQQSGTEVYFAEAATRGKILADGVVTKTPGMILGLFTADCVPVLMADYQNGVIGAAHAGWRGAVRGVIENTLNLMVEKGAEANKIMVALGPCIQQKSFEVGKEVRDECMGVKTEYSCFFAEGKDNQHFWFDLEGLVRCRVKEFGVKNITASGIDTYSDEENYYSFRRNCHQGLVDDPQDFPCHFSLIKL